ncbi:MAG: hypothetical protein H6611_04485 [Ignavibacteriales bacterium]|nr:hypothetical protein [Ignavibacteriales bacterium]
MKKLFYTSLFIITSFFNGISQNNNLGLRLEFFTYNLEKIRDYDSYSSEFEFSYLPGFYVFYSHQINERISLIIKPGFFFSGDGKFNGFDIGGFFRSNFKLNSFYLTCGLNYIGLNVSGGNTHELESNPYFLSLGVGYNIDEHVNVDLDIITSKIKDHTSYT